MSGKKNLIEIFSNEFKNGTALTDGLSQEMGLPLFSNLSFANELSQLLSCSELSQSYNAGKNQQLMDALNLNKTININKEDAQFATAPIQKRDVHLFEQN